MSLAMLYGCEASSSWDGETSSISQPVSLLQVGNRDLNEDYIFPSGEKSKRTTKLFVVADGLGGKGKGEVASKMATDIISDYILDLPTD